MQSQLEVEERVLQEIKLSLSALDCIMHQGEVIYASMPVTGGKRRLDAYRRYGAGSIAELDSIDPAIYRQVKKENIAAGIAFGDRLRSSGHNVIVPAQFFAPGWLQHHYMSFWKNVIQLHAQGVALDPDYQYAEGCVEELAIGLGEGKKVGIGEELRPIILLDELAKIREVILEYEQVKADPSRFVHAYRELSLLQPRLTAKSVVVSPQYL